LVGLLFIIEVVCSVCVVVGLGINLLLDVNVDVDYWWYLVGVFIGCVVFIVVGVV